MDESETETDPRRKVPTILWLGLGLLLMAMFAAVVFLLLGHPPQAVGPPPGVP